MTNSYLSALARKEKSSDRKQSKLEKRINASELAVFGGIPGPQMAKGSIIDGPRPPRNGKSLKSKPRRLPSRKKQVDAIKKRILGVGGLWSQAVRNRDGKCIMCYKTETLQAHHWLFRRGHSMALAVDIANGATLCYGCHIGRVHHDGDGDFIFRLGDTMTALVGPGKVAEMRITAQTSQPMSLEWWQEKEKGFRG